MARKLTTDPDELEKKEGQQPSGGNGEKDTADQDINAGQEGKEGNAEQELLKENEELKRQLEEYKKDAAVSPNAGSRRRPKTKKVKIKVPYDHRHKDDLTVGLNGTIYRIQRGKEVEVPEDVAEIIERSLDQDMRTEQMISELMEEAERNSRG